MEILSASGISAAGCQIDVVKDDTWPLYVGFSLALIAAMLCFLHSDLRSACLRCLREEQAAEREELKLEIMLEETPWLCKNRDIQMRSLSAKIRGLISGGDLEQAEIEGNYYLDRCHNDYHRLPMLAMIAEVKEMLEKPLEAADLRKRLLRYSPENHEVLKAMAYGPCTYSYTRLKAHDFTGIILRAAYVLAVMFFLFQLTDGAAHSKGQEGSPVYIETEMSSSAGIDNKETTPSALKETASEEPVDSIVRKAADCEKRDLHAAREALYGYGTAAIF